MLRIDCPLCGLRDHAEYAYGGDASRTRPDHGDADPGTWADYVYLRPNPKGVHREFWCHAGGCREWLVVVRDTVTHRILSVDRARAPSPADQPDRPAPLPQDTAPQAEPEPAAEPEPGDAGGERT